VHTDVVAVYNQVHLLGRVRKVSAMQCELLPLENEDTGLIDGVIIPADRRDVILKNRPRVQLTPVKNGTLRGDVDRSTVVNVGDVVQLLDDLWLHSAQGMFIGKVEAVEPKESEPLRNTITVRPVFDVSQVAYVTLKIEMEASTTQPADRSTRSSTTAPATRSDKRGSGGDRP
jgi:cell shape-determining protein MreC